MEKKMKSFGIDKNYEEINFEEVTPEDLQMISGGSGGGLTPMEGGLIILGLASFPISAPLMAFTFALGMTLVLGQALG
jgi:hypothetical protein